jgi:general stress protein YciG
MDEQADRSSNDGPPTKARKHKWTPRLYNRPEGYYSRIGVVGGSAPHSRPPGYFERIGALPRSKREGAEKAAPDVTPARKHTEPNEGTARGETPVANLGSALIDETREQVKPRGEMTVREAGRRGGRKVREERGLEYYAAIGRVGGHSLLETRGREHFVEMAKAGGAATIEKYDAEYFVEIGKAGGAAIKAKYGREYFSAIGRAGASKRWQGKARPGTPEADEYAEPTEGGSCG